MLPHEVRFIGFLFRGSRNSRALGIVAWRREGLGWEGAARGKGGGITGRSLSVTPSLPTHQRNGEGEIEGGEKARSTEAVKYITVLTRRSSSQTPAKKNKIN